MAQESLSTGWVPDLPDFRDYTPESKEIAEILAKSRPLKKVLKSTPQKVDLRQWCPPIEDQKNLGSCTANAGVGLIEYFQRRAFGQHLDASRLFLYKATRNLMRVTGDTGAYLRTTMQAMVLFGVPPESHLTYNVAKFDEEPSAFLYSFGQAYKALKYFRLDQTGVPPAGVLTNVKQHLAAGLPCMFGFRVYSSIPPLGTGSGDIPFPGGGDTAEGGHAVVAVGYDDKRKIGKDTGALLIRNSWGTGWGEGGYGHLPYSYVMTGLALDFWSLVQADFVDTALFK